MSAWDDLAPAQRERVLWRVANKRATFKPHNTEDIVRWAVDAYVAEARLVVGAWTSKEYLADLKEKAHAEGWEDGHQAGWDEAVAAAEQYAQATAEVAS